MINKLLTKRCESWPSGHFHRKSISLQWHWRLALNIEKKVNLIKAKYTSEAKAPLYVPLPVLPRGQAERAQCLYPDPTVKGVCVIWGWGGGIKGREITGCIGVGCPWWRTVSKNSLTSSACASGSLTITPRSVFRGIIWRMSWRFLRTRLRT